MSNPSEPETGFSEQFLYQTQVQTAVTILFEQAVAEQLNMNVTDLHCANLVRIMGPMTAGKIAELSGLTTGAVTGMLDRLEKIGFVRRETDPKDRRRVFVHANNEAMSATIGPLYDGLARHSIALISTYNEGQVRFLLDHMQRNNQLMMDEVAQVRLRHSPEK